MTGSSTEVPADGMDRRRLLRNAGLAAAGGVGVTILSDTPAWAAQTAVTAINVKDSPYSATGDGSTDDRAAIQRALDDVGSAGGAVFFPPGDYVVSGPLVPKSRTLMYGSHVPRWDKPVNPPSSCKIRVRSAFSGSGLVAPAADATAVAIRNLALVGADVGSGIHGLRLPDASVAIGAQTWTFEDVTIAGFSGSGIYGRLHVGLLARCFIHNNREWGVNASAGNDWNDVHVADCFVYFNRLGNLYFGGSEESAGIDFSNCRFERAGTNPDDSLSPLNADAPGVRLASARNIEFVNCTTDANTGNGFEMVHESDTVDYRPDNILLANCRFARDGTGDQSTLGNFAGVKVQGPTSQSTDMPVHIKLVNCGVTAGKASDSGAGTIIGPRYGVWFENTRFFQWMGGRVAPSSQASDNWYYSGTGTNVRPTIVDLERGLMTLPTAAPSSGTPKPEGTVYFDKANSRLRVWDGTAWRSVTLS